jgi:hypothetical protein
MVPLACDLNPCTDAPVKWNASSYPIRVDAQRPLHPLLLCASAKALLLSAGSFYGAIDAIESMFYTSSFYDMKG